MATKLKIQPAEPRNAADRELVSDVVAEIQAQLAVISARREALAPGGFDPELASAAASLGKVLLAGAAERRQQSKATVREVASIPISTILDFLRTLPLERRNDIAAVLTDADADEPLL